MQRGRIFDATPSLIPGLWILLPWLLTSSVWAVPMVLSYQGHILESGRAIEGDVDFKFALLDETGATVWSHDGTSQNGSEPAGFLKLNLRRGVYSIGLGDTTIAGMEAIPPAALESDLLFLRIWFRHLGAFTQFSPDQSIGAVAFAVRSRTAETVESLPDGLVETQHLAPSLQESIEQSSQQIAMLTDALEKLTERVNAVDLDRLVAVSTDAFDPVLDNAGYEAISTINTVEWSYGPDEGEPTARAGHSGIWTGSQFLTWGGVNDSGTFFGSGGVFDLDQETWAPLSPVDAPVARTGHSTVWTGDQMIVWGGIGLTGWLDSGGRYSVAGQFWQPLPMAGAPEPRDRHLGVWTGSRMVVWGGENGSGPLADGSLFDPETNAWAPLTVSDPPVGRAGATGIWASDRLIVWGGEDLSGPIGEGAALVFEGNTPDEWVPLSEEGAPSERLGHSVVWTGNKMIVWGGEDDFDYLNDGAIYDPAADAWTPVSDQGAPDPRSFHNAVWTGEQMIIHGGEDDEGTWENSYAYDPEFDEWQQLSDAAATPRTEATTVWTGEFLLTYGGYDFVGEVIPWLEYVEAVPVYHLFRKP